MAHKISKKVIACILVLAFMLQSIPVLMFMAFGEFAAENLFQTHLDKAASFGVSMIIDSGRVEKNGRFSADVIGASVDGDKDASTFVGGMNADTPARYMGAVYVLEDVYYLDKLTFFSGDKGYPDSYRVYVSETLADTEKFADLFSEGNRINSKDVACEVDQQELPIGRRAKYVAVIHTGTEGARVREFELWSGEQPADYFTPENLFQSALESSASFKLDASGSSATKSTTLSADDLAATVDGVWSQLYKGSDAGVLYTLDDVYYADKVTLFSGDAFGSQKYPDSYRVYASDTLEDAETLSDLLTAENLMTPQDVNVLVNGVDVEIGRKIKYVAIFHTSSDNTRIQEFQLWSGKPAGPENLFQTHLESARGMKYFPSNGSVDYGVTAVSQEMIDSWLDGDTANGQDLNSGPTWTPAQWLGAEFKLDGLYEVDKLTIYGGAAGYPDTYCVFASDKLETLYTADSMIAGEVADCLGEARDVAVGKQIQYVAIVCNGTDDYHRPKEFQLWSVFEDEGGDEEFVSENLFRTHLDVQKTHGVNMFVSNGGTEEGSQFSAERIAQLVDGDLTGQVFIGGALGWDPPRYLGAVFALDDVYFADKLTLYSGDSGIADHYRVYASDKLDGLYNEENRITAEDVVCTDKSAPVELKIGKKIKYVAIFNTSGDTRAYEFQLWSGKEDEGGDEEFEPENLFGTDAVASSDGFVKNIAGNYFQDSARMDGALPYLTDGDTTNTQEFPCSNDWLYGVKYELDGLYYIDRLTIYSGKDGQADSYLVFASETEDALYQSIVAEVTVSDGTPAEVKIGKNIQYVAILGSVANKNVHPKELELWTGEEPQEPGFESENLFGNHLDTDGTHGVNMFVSSGGTEDASQFSAERIAQLVDGDLTGQVFIGGALGWDPPRYLGAVFALDDVYFADKLTLYAGDSGFADHYRIYASDSLDDLYETANLMTPRDAECRDKGTPVDVKIGKKVKYVAIFNTSGDVRAYEYQLWSGEDTGEEPEDHTAKKVLTIGNSFSENASIYASQIAANQGYNLTFGYLKLSSGTIEQHWANAQSNAAVYKFAYTDPDGTRHNIKEEGSAGATIQEALEYMDWDIIVFQQGSAASGDFSSYAHLSDLIGYAEELCPDAEQMIHETWSWGSQPADAFEAIESAYHRAAEANGLIIIPSGRAFEFARTALGSRTILNIYDDGRYQHANGYGQFVAGASYVAAIFGCDITDNTFVVTDSGVEGSVDMKILRKAVMDAMDYVPGQEVDTSLIAGKNPDKFGVATENNKKPVDSGSSASVGALTDGLRDPVEFWGGKDIHNTRFSFIFYLGANYDLTGAQIQAVADVIDVDERYKGMHKGIKSATIYASRYYADLLNEANGVVVKDGYADYSQPDTASTFTAEAPESWKGARYVAFVITIDDYAYGACRLEELKVFGTRSKMQDPAETIPEEPDVYSGIIAGMEAIESGVAYDDLYHPTDGNNNSIGGDHGSLALTDGALTGIEYWGGKDAEAAKFVFIYNLGANYDLTDATVFGTVDSIDTEFSLHRGIKTATIYASRYYDDLFGEASGVVVKDGYESDNINVADVNSVFTAQAPESWKTARYVAFVITIGDSKYGACRLREFRVNGTRSAVQDSEEEIPVGPERKPSIIEGLEADYYGVATDDLADPVYAGASQGIGGLTDGVWTDMEFWGGKDTENSSFVFIYDLYGNYDLTGAAIDSVRDTFDDATGVHKGIETATIYASRTFENLFAEGSGVVAKSGYEDPSRADRATNFEITAPESWKMARYVAFVITIDDSTYGACRLQELQVYGTLSATQDEEPEEERLPQYLDISGSNGVILRLFQKDGRDDLAALGAKLVVTLSEDKADLDPVGQKLGGLYEAAKLYTVKLVDAGGKEIPLNGRIVRLSLPAEDSSVEWKIACVDDSSAELISSSKLGNAYTVETETLRAYATVKAAGAANGGTDGDEPAAAGTVLPTVLWAVAVVLGVLAVGGIALTVVAAVKRKKEN